MKKTKMMIALLLALLLSLSACSQCAAPNNEEPVSSAAADAGSAAVTRGTVPAAEAAKDTAPTAEPTDVPSAEPAPEAREPVHMVVGNTTKVSGGFFTTFFGNNTSDIDVRTMIHGYSPVYWDDQLKFIVDPMVAEALERSEDGEGITYTITLCRDLLYCDGKTPITAQDYVFSWLLAASPELGEIGGTAPELNVAGYEAYRSGESKIFAGIHLLDDYRFSVTIKKSFDPYFYEYSQLALNPYPISVLAPGCMVADDGDGAYLTASDGGECPFTAELIKKTILDPVKGYRSHPQLTSGPYVLTGYDSASGHVEFEINPWYKGNHDGQKPTIDSITLVPVEPADMIEKLRSGEVDLLNKCVDRDVIDAGLALCGEGAFNSLDYPRLGYGFCAFSCEKGPQQFQAVRQALNYAFDSKAFVEQTLGEYGIPVYGYYGMGQWMYGAAVGGYRPVGATEEEGKAWDAFSLDSLNKYELDLKKAKKLLVRDGWTLNKDGKAFREGKDKIRYKKVDGELMPLTLRFAQCRDNPQAALVVSMYAKTLPKIGAKLEVEEVSFNELLSDYYREDGERRFDMNFMATNFVSTFDPYLVFLGNPELQGAVNTSGIVDEKLVKRAWEMRCTPPGDLATFEQRWLKMQERFNEVLPTMPIYSNLYYDFHTRALTNYRTDAEYSWPVAILYAEWDASLAE